MNSKHSDHYELTLLFATAPRALGRRCGASCAITNVPQESVRSEANKHKILSDVMEVAPVGPPLKIQC